MAQNAAIQPTTKMGEAALAPQSPNPRPPVADVVVSVASTLVASTDTDDTLEADWEHITSEPSAASAPSTAETINVNPTTGSGSVPNPASVSNTTATGAMELTYFNVNLHNMAHNPYLSLYERLCLSQRGRSTVVSTNFPPEQASLTHVSDMTIDLGESFANISVDPQDSHVFGVGAWADIERPPM